MKKAHPKKISNNFKEFARVVKYRTHRGVYAGVIQEGKKYIKIVIIDQFPIHLKVVRIDQELKYMDYYKEYPLLKACNTILNVGAFKGIERGAKMFIEQVINHYSKEIK